MAIYFFKYLILEYFFPLIELLYFDIELILALLGLELLPHAETDWWVVESLIGCDGHFEFIFDPHQKDAPVRTIYGDLPNDLIETLTMQLLSDRTDAALPRLTVQKSFVQKLLQFGHVLSTRRVLAHVLNILLMSVSKFARSQNAIQYVLHARPSLHHLITYL